MKIRAFYDREQKEHVVELPERSTVADLLKKINLNPVAVIVSRNNTIILEQEALHGNDDVKIYSVISGG